MLRHAMLSLLPLMVFICLLPYTRAPARQRYAAAFDATAALRYYAADAAAAAFALPPYASVAARRYTARHAYRHAAPEREEPPCCIAAASARRYAAVRYAMPQVATAPVLLRLITRGFDASIFRCRSAAMLSQSRFAD